MAKKVLQANTKYHCRDCTHSHSWYGSDWKGEVFMCRCHKSEWAKLLSSIQCKHFELKNG